MEKERNKWNKTAKYRKIQKKTKKLKNLEKDGKTEKGRKIMKHMEYVKTQKKCEFAKTAIAFETALIMNRIPPERGRVRTRELNARVVTRSSSTHELQRSPSYNAVELNARVITQPTQL